jgi:hypothetical protein
VNNALPVAVLAKRTADARRVIMNTFSTDLGLRMAVDLMGIEHPSRENMLYAKIIADTHRDTLADSMLFVADNDMVDLLDAASATMPDQHLHPTDIITPHGFVYFAQPLPDRSGTPPEIPIHAFSWAFLPKGSPLLAERDADDSILITSYVTLMDSLMVRSMYQPGDQLAPNLPKYVPNATAMWTVGSLIGKVFGEEPPAGGYTPGFYQRIAAAFWTLAQQPKLTSTTQESPGKPADRRRNRRAGVIDPNAPVHVVRLHHRVVDSDAPTSGGGAGTGHKMTVRAATRGHWRKQWYPSVEQHRHIWIDPFWRGPEGAPVVGGERVFLATGPKSDPGQR